jgi:hypothetical protein
MGASSDAAEALIGGVALFVNGDAGDIDPSPATCNGMPNFAGAPTIASAIQRIRNSITVCNPSTAICSLMLAAQR